MTAMDVPRAIQNALDREQNKIKQLIGGIKMTETTANEITFGRPNRVGGTTIQGGTTSNLTLIRESIDPETGARIFADQDGQPVNVQVLTRRISYRGGRTIIIDENGRRLPEQRPASGAQTGRIDVWRKQLGQAPLSQHNRTQMSVDSASLMIDMYIQMEGLVRDLRSEIMILQDKLEAVSQAYPSQTKEILQAQADRAKQGKA